MGTNKILYEYILKKYGDVVNFAYMSGIPSIDLNAVLLKDNISTEIGMGLNLCKVLNIDIEKMVFNNQIKDFKHETSAGILPKIDKADEAKIKNEIYNKCMRLSEIEKKKVLEYICSISGEKNEAEQ